MKHIGNGVLAVWLILTGLRAVANLHFRYESLILGVLAIVAGVLIALRR